MRTDVCLLIFLPLLAGCAAQQKIVASPAGEMKAIGVAADRAGAHSTMQKAMKAGPSIDQALVCTGVSDRVPRGGSAVFDASVGRLCFYTVVTGASRPITLYHVWVWDGKEMAKVPVQVNSARWRTHSAIKIDPSCAGPWQAQAVDADGKQLASVDFSIREPQ